MQRPSDKRLSKSAYDWLRVSPLATVTTYAFLSAADLGDGICNVIPCSYRVDFYLSALIALLGSALWHLNLLKYINNKDSEFVRWHGLQAALIAGIRTLIPILFLIADFLFESGGYTFCISVPALLVVWMTATPWGNKQVDGDECKLATWLGEPISPPETWPAETPQQSYTQATATSPETKNAEEAIPLTDEPLNTENPMTDSESKNPEDVLKNILDGLRSADDVSRLNAISQLHLINYSSEAIRNELEKLAIHDENADIRKDALIALDTATQKHVRSRINRLEAGSRFIILSEISEWERLGLLDKVKAAVLRKRYDFDRTATPAARTVKSETESAKPQTTSAPEPAAPPPPKAEAKPEEPRATLTQTLLSETSIKIALYLGAFFVVASAAILAALSPAARLPVLFIASFIFGGLSIVIRKRLPQPSFALFIVFSFLLPITASVLEDTVQFSPVFSSIYWVLISISMALIWGGSVWLYESRVFSMMSFIAFAVAFYRIGNVFDAEPEVFGAVTSLAALGGLLGVWILKKWKGDKFALPLFLTTLVVQALILGGTIIVFGVQLYDRDSSQLWNLASVFTWGSAFIFFVLADILFPFIFFSWFAALALIPIPWFIGSAFDMEIAGLALLHMVWGLILSVVSEAVHRFDKTRKFSLPMLLASIPTFTLALINAFDNGVPLGFAIALGVACVYAALHLIRARGWLWALALLNFIMAYFAFFNLPLFDKTEIYFGYLLLGLSVLFLLPDLFSKNDFNKNTHWRLAPRIYGVLFTLYASGMFLAVDSQQHAYIGFAVLSAFFALYTLAQREAFYGYIPAAYLALTVLFALDHFELDLWMPALTVLAALFYLAGTAALSKESWSRMLRNCALILGTLVSLVALFTLKETGGWYALIVGVLFASEMYLTRNGWFEIGLPILFNIGALLILRDFDITRSFHHLLAYSLVWLGSDLIAHLTFAHLRPLKWIVRGVGALLTIVNYGALLSFADAKTGTLDFGIYTLLVLTINLVYRQPNLLYAFTLTLPLFVVFGFRAIGVEKWIHPVIFVAMVYYAAGFFLRLSLRERAKDWDTALLFSGLGWGVIISMAAPIVGGLDAAIPVAIAATLWAVEAFARRNVWLGFPANGLYLLSYFIILIELKVDQPQFFSMGAAALGLLQHYLLTRAGSRTGTFIMGMLSQLTLLGTTYIQMANTEQLIYFVVLFFQSIAVLFYGLVIRSRSLTFTPIAFVVLGVITVLYTALKGLNTVVLIGCTGMILLTLGILAVLMRECITKLGERLSDWKA